MKLSRLVRPRPRWSLALALALGAIAALAGTAAAEGVTGAADDLRTGWYPDEPALTPAAVSGGGFQQVFKASLQGQIYAQPLTADGTLLVVTEDDRAYGLDPNSGGIRWEDQLGTPVNSSEAPIECTDLSPHIGITGTPVIDASGGIAYFVSNSYISGSSGPIAWYMHALRLADGHEAPGFPVQISGHAQNLPTVEFKATQELQRPALLLMNGVIYAAFGSHCDKTPYQGWIAGVTTGAQLVTLWASARSGASIWQSGGGLVSDAPGQILLATGNDSGAPGEGDPPKGPGTTPPEGRLGESVVRAHATPTGGLTATDFFSPFNSAQLDENDVDLGSGAPIALPSPYFGTAAVPHLLVQVGKQGYVYVLNRDRLGGMGQGPGGSDQVVQRLGPYGGVWDGSAVWPGEGGYLYIPGVNGGSDHLRFFKNGVDEATGEPALSLAATSSEPFAFGSGAPIVTSNATTSGSAVVWINRCTHYACSEGELVAYAPVPVGESLHALWRAPLGAATKFSRPDASDGHIYVGNHEGALLAFSGPALTPSASALDLGSQALGEPLSGVVTLTNTGTRLTVSAVRPPVAPFQASGLPPVGSELAPGQQISVRVSLDAPVAGSFNGSLGITTEAGETSVALSGSLAQPVPGGAAATPQGGASASILQGAPALAAGIAGAEVPASLTHLRLIASASKQARRRRPREVVYVLSAASSVALTVERPVVSHHCARGARTCVHYRPTHVTLSIRGHANTNVVELDLAHLPAGEYRLSAVAIDSAGTRGIARHLEFSAR
jgi:outer membrane protein assembly factor BamB